MAEKAHKPRHGADDWQQSYEQGTTPWDSGLVDPALKAVIESKAVSPCKTLEVGCGTGTNAVYLAKAGFEVTAADFAPLAIEKARRKAAEAGAAIEFQVADLAELKVPPASVEFLFDRGCYHCLRREGRLSDYQKAVKQLMRPGGRLLVLCGSTDSPHEFGPPKVSAAEVCGDFEKLLSYRTVDGLPL
ncbi:MAG: class I SAM-dependent methyltransferase [Pirellulales bacterium]